MCLLLLDAFIIVRQFCNSHYRENKFLILSVPYIFSNEYTDWTCDVHNVFSVDSLTVKDSASLRDFLFDNSSLSHIFMLSSKLCWDNHLHLVNKKIPLHLHLLFTFFVRPCGWSLFYSMHCVHVLWFLLPQLAPPSTENEVTSGMSTYQPLSGAGRDSRQLTSQQYLKQLKCKRRKGSK